MIGIVNRLIKENKLDSTKTWKSSSTDKKAKATRRKAASKEAKEAEEAAKELGIWDEFYGSGAKGKRKGREEGKGDGDGGEDGLRALIQKRQKEREGGLNALEEKYTKMEEEEKAKRKAKGKKGKAESETKVGKCCPR